MLHFDSDYMEGAHPDVLKRLVDTNMEQTTGYGSDSYTASAKEKIRAACRDHSLDVHLLVGGTQTNATVIDALLAHHEGVVAADTGHINVHEAGAIEATGHKVIALPHSCGKLPADALARLMAEFSADEANEHMVAPGAVYISQPTEYGTLYSKAELEQIRAVCDQYGLRLYVDGARLAFALGSEANDVSLPELARLADVFYIGGTKAGALFGEAVVARKGVLRHFVPLMKQHGALLAKGRLLGLQFDALFTDGLYERIGAHAVGMAMQIRDAFVAKGFVPYINSPTNQQFFELPNEVIDKLKEHATFEYWGAKGEKVSVVRFVTSWAAQQRDIDAFTSVI